MAGRRLRWIVQHRITRRDSHFQPSDGTNPACLGSLPMEPGVRSGVEEHMNGIIYIIGLIVVILAILSFLGLRGGEPHGHG